MKIFKYKTFLSSAEFEEWQQANPEPQAMISQVSPIVLQIDSQFVSPTDSEITPNFGCFVLYWETV